MSTFEQTIEQHHVIQFGGTVEMALQQMGPIMRPYISEQPCNGEQSAYINLFGKATASRRSGRKAENKDAPVERTRRWLIYDDPLESGEYIDSADMWRQAMDPTSSLIGAHTQAIGRGIDTIIFEGLTGSAYEGKRGETSKPLPDAQKVGIQFGSGDTPADVGMNVKKLREARKKLRKAHVDLTREQAFVAISADEHDALFEFVEATSADYQDWDAAMRPAYREGRLTRFMGFNFVEHEEIPTNAAMTIRYCPVWVKSGLVLGVWSDIRPRLWNDSGRNQTPVFNIDFVGDARRTQDGKVVEIACKIPE